jgi:hypothetical protein
MENALPIQIEMGHVRWATSQEFGVPSMMLRFSVYAVSEVIVLFQFSLG